MGLLSRLITTKDQIGIGSPLSYSDGSTPLINKLSTKESPLHYNAADDEPGYSVNGTDASYVNSLYQGYEDGKNTPIPEPTTLDLLDPITADPDNKPKYTPIPGQTYSDLYNKF
jgi:hypothetical protein